MEITWHELKKKLPNIKIIDIRENYLYSILRIKDSINIPYQFLILNPNDYLKKDIDYYLVCEHGHKSKLVSEILNKDGFITYSIIGGIKEYQKIEKKIIKNITL